MDSANWEFKRRYLVAIHKENVECRSRNIEYRSDESPSLRLWPDKYWIFKPPSRGRLETTRFAGGGSVRIRASPNAVYANTGEARINAAASPCF